MILRDQLGEVEVSIGDEFEYQGALLGVVCPETSLCRIILVRLKTGSLERDGQRFEATSPDTRLSPAGFLLQPCFRFAGDLVAGLVREHRLMTFDIPVVPPLDSAADPAGRKGQDTNGSDRDIRRARASKTRAEQNQPTTRSLFD